MAALHSYATQIIASLLLSFAVYVSNLSREYIL
jgi:hypothetical protein